MVSQQWFPLHLGHIWTPLQHRKQLKKHHNVFVYKAILMLPLDMPLGYTITIFYKLKSFLVIIDLKLNTFQNMMYFLHIISIFKFNILSLSIPHYLY